ncbi:MAG TPA: DUF2171 domain-containing protein [Sphingomicrobium sp.]
MAYDRYDSRRGPRDQSRFQDDRYRDNRGDRGDREERGFFERAGEQIASWFGDEDDDDRYAHDRMGSREREGGRDQGSRRNSPQPQGWGTPSPRDRDYGSPRDRDYADRQERGTYRPVTGDYGRSEGSSGGRGFERGGYGDGQGGRPDQSGRSESPWGRDEYRRTSFAGSSERRPEGGQSHDPHYQQWRQRQIDDLDRDYDEYRREHQSKFENDFGSWRSTRQTKRQMLGQVREHMDVVGSDGEHVGTIDKVAGDRIILTKSDEAAGGVHHSLSCSDIDRIDGDKLVLGTPADQARNRWREEGERPAFDQGSRGEGDGDGPHILDRSFLGTYR